MYSLQWRFMMSRTTPIYVTLVECHRDDLIASLPEDTTAGICNVSTDWEAIRILWATMHPIRLRMDSALQVVRHIRKGS